MPDPHPPEPVAPEPTERGSSRDRDPAARTTDPAPASPSESASRSWRRWLRPLHPTRLRARLLHLANLLGWHHVHLWIASLHPSRLRLSLEWWRSCREERKRRRADPRLTVAVDVSPLWEPLTGIGWYLYRLLEALEDREDLALRLYGPDLIDKGDLPPPRVALPQGKAIERVRYRVPEGFVFAWQWWSDRLRGRESQLIAKDRNQLIFAPNFLPPERFSKCRGRWVVTVHDLTVEHFPHTMRESTRLQLQARLRSTLARAARVITDSEAVRRELVQADLAEAERISTIWLASAAPAPAAPAPAATAPAATGPAVPVEPPPGLPQRYVLFVGTLEPRKDLATLVQAFERWRQGERGRDDVCLVICGAKGWKSSELSGLLRVGEEAGWLRRYGYLPDRQLAALYRDAEWVALSSVYEGFGLPAVEAMAWGIPLLLSDIEVLREIGGDAALYAPPGDIGAWAALLGWAFAKPETRELLASRASQRSRLFSWQETARQTAEAFFLAAGVEPTEDPGGAADGLADGLLELKSGEHAGQEPAGEEPAGEEPGGRPSGGAPSGSVLSRLLRPALILCLLVVLASLAIFAHYTYWYAPRVRPAVPDDDVPAGLLAPESGFPLAAWMPYPHQSLGALARDSGIDTGALKAAVRLAGMPELMLPANTEVSIPPASSIAVASDLEGETFVIRARVYPLFAAFARLAGWLAENPWLSGGRMEAEGRQMEVAWEGTLWSVGSPRLPLTTTTARHASPPAATAAADPARASGYLSESSPADPALLWIVVRQASDPIPPGRYRLDVKKGALELVSDRLRSVEVPSMAPASIDKAGVLLLAFSAGGVPGSSPIDTPSADASSVPAPLDRDQAVHQEPTESRLHLPMHAMALFSHDPEDLAELPRAAVVHGPGKRLWDLPAEGLLEIAGRDPWTGAHSGFGLAATDAETLAGARRLAPELRALHDDGRLELGLWLELERAAVEAGRLRRSLERSPLVSPRQLSRWRDAETLLTGLAGPYGHLGLEIHRLEGDPSAAGGTGRALRLRVD